MKIALLGLAVMAATALAAPVQAQEARFAEEIHVFNVEDEVYPSKGCETLFVGSSSFRFWFGLNQDFPRMRILKRGFGGAQIADINARFDDVVGRYRPRHIAFYAGENDIDAGKTPAQAAAEFAAFMDRKRAVLGQVPVYYVSAKPSLARWEQFARQSELNRQIEESAAAHPDLVYVDIVGAMLKQGKPDPALFISDGLHMNSKGYKLWQAKIDTAFRRSPASKPSGC